MSGLWRAADSGKVSDRVGYLVDPVARMNGDENQRQGLPGATRRKSQSQAVADAGAGELGKSVMCVAAQMPGSDDGYIAHGS